MPDWSYRTVLRPILFRLPPDSSRKFCLRFLDGLTRAPGGGKIIDFLGHMRPDQRLSRAVLGKHFAGPVGLSSAIDPDGIAALAFARFGFSFIEVGPVSIEASNPSAAFVQSRSQDSFILARDRVSSLGEMQERSADWSHVKLPIFVRLHARRDWSADVATQNFCQIIEHLGAKAAGFVLPTLSVASEAGWTMDQWRLHLEAVIDGARRLSPGSAVLLSVGATQELAAISSLLELAQVNRISAFIVDGYIEVAEGHLYGAPAREAARKTAAQLRRMVGPDKGLIVAGGVHDPGDALGLYSAGADLVLVDSGLVFSGPGLPKRINEAMLQSELHAKPEPDLKTGELLPATQQTWFWTLLMGLAMLLGGILTMAIASTRVVLPYDEALVGITRSEIAEINARLLPFMQHDRVTLAGTMLAVGILYIALSSSAVRDGQHWARVAVLASGFAGFASFFLFLGFGYFDPLHAFVTAVLFQFLLLGLHSASPPAGAIAFVTLYEDRAWRMSQWGQLLFVVHGAVLITAGIVISIIGITTVFVPEDLWFLETCPATIEAANPRLIPLIAHDRATFGGMLIACGVVVLLSTLWGWQRGNRFLWWAFVSAGLIAYGATISVHLSIGYHHPGHLLPAYGGLMLLLAGLGLSYSYLARPGEQV